MTYIKIKYLSKSRIFRTKFNIKEVDIKISR